MSSLRSRPAAAATRSDNRNTADICTVGTTVKVPLVEFGGGAGAGGAGAGAGDVFLACEDFGRMVDNSFPARTLFYSGD